MFARVVLCLAAAALAAAAPPPPVLGHVSRADLKTLIEGEPNWGEMFRALRAEYPEEYEKLIDIAAEAVEATDGNPQAKQQSFAEMRRFMSSKTPFLVRAPDADLHAIALAYAELVHRLQRGDVALCARFSVQGFSPADTIPQPAIRILAHLNALQLHAMRHAESAPAAARGELQPADAIAFMAAVTRLDPASMSLVRDQSKLVAASDAEKCAAGIAVYDAAAALPEAQSANVIAALITHAPKAG